MKKWIKIIFKNNRRVESLCLSLDKRIEETALNVCESCAKLAERVILLNKKRAALINMRVIHNKIMEALTVEERDYVYNFIEKKNTDTYAGLADVKKIYSKAEKVLFILGYNNQKLTEDYSQFNFT